MKSHWLLLILLLVSGIYLQGQQINITNYSLEDGLVNNDVLNIYQDSQDFIWLCTRGGISRYDGNRFTNYTTINGLTSDMVNDICEIAPQEFVIAQNSGGPLRLHNERFSAFGNDPQLTINKFYSYRTEKLFAATDRKGIVCLHNNKLEAVNTAYRSSVQQMAVINDSLWAVMQMLQSVQVVTSHSISYSSVYQLKSTTLYADSHGRVWLGTSAGLRLLAPTLQANQPVGFLPLPAPFDLPLLRQSYITSFIEDSFGNYWIGTNTGLVSIQAGGRSSFITDADGLPSPAVNCLLEDRQHNIWIGTSLGLAKISLINDVKIFTRKEGLSSHGIALVLPVATDRVWLFADNGPSELNLGNGRLHTRISSAKESAISGFFKLGNNQILAEKLTGAGIYNQKGEYTVLDHWPVEKFTCVAQLDPSTFIGSEGSSLFSFSSGKVQHQLSLPIADVISVISIAGNGFIWAGTTNSGLYKIKWNKDSGFNSLTVTDSVRQQLPDAHIRALYTDNAEELWVGTRYKGLIRLSAATGRSRYSIQQYGTAQGLSSDFVRTINRDKQNNIWAGTMQGIDKLTLSGNQYRVFNFGKVNKIFSQIFDISFFPDGYLLAAGFPYLLYAKDNQQDTMGPPPVYITQIYSSQPDRRFFSSESPATLPFNKAQIYFEFSAPQFINEKVTTYAYRLAGSNDTNWTMSGKSQSVYYASLQAGNYTFEVKAMGFNGKWGRPARYTFIVQTPFWRQAWFILLMGGIVILSGYVLYRYRIKQLLRVQQVRNRIATDLHDEIGSNLTNISILSNLSKKSLTQPEQANLFLQRISEEVANSSQSLDDIIWSVDASHDTLDETVSRMRRYAAELFDSAGINYDLQLDPLFEQRKLLMEQRRDVYLLYKEAVNNILKHAGAKQVLIKVSIQSRKLIFFVQDDGRGFETGTIPGRHGLKGMAARVQKWKGKIDIISAVNNGTSITIALPLAD